MSNDLQIENNEFPPLSLSHFNLWEDYLHNLKLDHTKIPQVPKEISQNIGRYGSEIARETVLSLREDYSDELGQPRILCVDEEPDEKVVVLASTKNRSEAFLNSIDKQLMIPRGFSDNPDRAKAFG